MHNLKNVDVDIPQGELVVITGLSGSGKSSLAFDTLYAEGQRRYVESLSSYARQFLGRLDKPEVDHIHGIAPAIAIEQKVISTNSRSTVGTVTEITDYLRLLFARIGKTFSPISGKEVKHHTAQDVVNHICNGTDGNYLLLATIQPKKGKLRKELELLNQQGFSRVLVDNKPERITALLEQNKLTLKHIELIIDRVSNDPSDENKARIHDSAESAFFEGEGIMEVLEQSSDSRTTFSSKFETDGIAFEEPSIHLFSFNSPLGACRTCEGFGSVIGVDKDLVIPDRSLSVYEEGVQCWKGDHFGYWKDELIRNAEKVNFPIHRPIQELTKEQLDMLWNGTDHFEGINGFFRYVESKLYKIHYRVFLSRFRGKTECPECHGSRLRKEASYVKVGGTDIGTIGKMTIEEAFDFFEQLTLGPTDQKIASVVIKEIRNRLKYLMEVGLTYLTLDRASNTLSGGESQRINLATSLGSSLVGSMYILDEPSIGLHPRDTHRLIGVLKSLRDLGNTVIVVEHDEEVMEAADRIIDMGPLAGTHGGEVVFAGTHQDLVQAKDSLTAKYLTGKEVIPIPDARRKWKKKLQLKGASANNLKNLDVTMPLECMTVVTGVSGSGKSTLIRDVLQSALLDKLEIKKQSRKSGFRSLEGDLRAVEHLEVVDQNPIGKSSRSNPVTYVKAYDEIRALMAVQPSAKAAGLDPSHFSFNVEGGRCEVCKGEGTVTVEMQFMADVQLQCDECKGKRFTRRVLDIQLKEKNIADILDMTIEDAMHFFGDIQEKKGNRIPKLLKKLQPLVDVGLGYLTLGQSSSTLSGGEAQRIKLASFLTQSGRKAKTLFIFDEPTTGLHFHDIRKLLIAFDGLIEQGHSVIIIEHHGDVIKHADWVIDLGPEGGKEGGHIVFEGTPEKLIECTASYTGKFLRNKLVHA